LVLGLLDLTRDQALALVLSAADDVLAIHGCEEAHRARLRAELSAWLGPKLLREFRLYGGKNKIEVKAKGRDRRVSSKVFEGHGCELSPVQ
jgi:hypothetical protein